MPLKENLNLKKIKNKVQNNKIEIRVLRGLVHDLRSQDKDQMVILYSYSLNKFTIHEAPVYRRIMKSLGK
jgi:hypothetical protein